ncbi:hypothetical protein [Demequina oxidasica]|uniref:hypothetical protein n=1 Tax=Demequina oxidasica TaxID=676199 RepID=UPI000780F5E8|nr:hypothetical protein [Demequina oxidasica]
MITSGLGISIDSAFVLEQIKKAQEQVYPDESSVAKRRGPQVWTATNVFDDELDREAKKIGQRAQVLREQLVDFADDIKAALTQLSEVDADASIETDKLHDQAEQTEGLLTTIVNDDPAPTPTPTPTPSSTTKRAE